MPILHWLTRDEDLRAAARAPYRLLEEAADLSAGESDAERVSEIPCLGCLGRVCSVR